MTQWPDRHQVERFRNAVARRFGLHYDEAKLDFLGELLRQRVASTGGREFNSYVEELLNSNGHSEESRTLIEQLTVTETFFFRNADNFRALTQAVLPSCLQRRQSERRLRVLSAGCASGEEAYSLAIAVREALVDWRAWDVKIVAIDLNPAMLRKAARARYTTWSLRATPDVVRDRYFRAVGNEYLLDPEVQAMVSFEEQNLSEEDPLFWQSECFDFVFCRNVLMYFLPEVAMRAVRRIWTSLRQDGFLFLGHAETLRTLSQDFHLCHTHDTFYYQKRGVAGASKGEAVLFSDVQAACSPIAPQSEARAEVIQDASSWVDAIASASERIAALARAPVQAPRTDRVAGREVTIPASRALDFQLVLEAMRQERFSDALALLSALPDEASREPDALLLRAILLTNTGRMDEVAATCTQLLALDELNAGAHYVMALCREHAGDVAGAIEHDRTAVYLDANFAMPHLHLGLLARRTGDEQMAREELAQAIRLVTREDTSRLLLFGGGFARETLLVLCRNELRAAGGEP